MIEEKRGSKQELREDRRRQSKRLFREEDDTRKCYRSAKRQ